jgi:hypothetical protein
MVFKNSQEEEVTNGAASDITSGPCRVDWSTFELANEMSKVGIYWISLKITEKAIKRFLVNRPPEERRLPLGLCMQYIEVKQIFLSEHRVYGYQKT